MTRAGIAAGAVATLGVIATVSSVALSAPAAASAAAQSAPDRVTVRLTPGVAGEYSGARVSLVMTQREYADISLNVTFEDFTAVRPFPFRERSCPRGLVDVDAPAEVFKCGWEQDGDTAILRMALAGTFDRSRITVTFASDALIAPTRPGVYEAGVSGWSFVDVDREVVVLPGPCAEGLATARGDVTCP